MTTRILLIQLRQLGDIILTTPCTRELKRHFSDCHITFLSHRMGRLVLDGNPYIDENIYYDEKDGVAAQLKLMNELRRRKYDVVIDFMNNPRSALMTLATFAKQRIAFRSARRWAYNNIVDKPKDPFYIVNEKFALLRTLGAAPSDISLVLPTTEQNFAVTQKFLEHNPTLLNSSLRFIFSPTHRREVRQWSLENYAELNDRLVANFGATVTWLWGPGEEAVIDRGLSLCRQQAFKAPKTSFREMAALIAEHDVFVGNSNGPSHVAVAVGAQSVQLHGHTDAKSWCPLNEKHLAIQSPLQFSDPDRAMAAITVDQVYELLAQQMRQYKSAAALRISAPQS